MDNLCLLCASIGSGSQVNVLDNEYSLQRVNDVLNLSIKSSEEHLPKTSCRRCWVKISAYKDFQLKCKNTIIHHKDIHRIRTNHAGGVTSTPTENTIINMETNGLIISDVRSGYNNHINIDSGSDSLHTQLLLPMSPINDISHYNSESGGYIENRGRESYICSYCNNKYKRFGFYKKHILKHEREENRKNQLANIQLMTYKCETCDAEFSRRKLLKQHMNTHKSYIVCSNCNLSFTLEDKYKWHIAQCEGVKRANNDEQPFRRRTRSQSCASSGFASFAETDYQTNKWVENVDIYDDDDDDDNDDCRSVRSDTTNGSTFSGVSICSQLTTKSGISIRSTYSAKPTLTTEALLNTKNVLQSMPQTRNTMKQMAIVSIDINMRKGYQQRCQTPFRRFHTVKSSKKLLDCSCGYRPKDLKDIVEHDVNVHNAMLSYRCTECNSYYSKPEYLRMHEHRDHINTYKCYMCGKFVKSKSALKLHYEYHVEKTHNCRYCEMSYLKIDELVEHYKTHTEKDKNKTVGRILEAYTYIERPVIAPVISDGRLRVYERIQKSCEIERKALFFCQRLGGRVKTQTSFEDRLEDTFVEVPEYPKVIPDEFWEQRLIPIVIPIKKKKREAEINGFEEDYDESESENGEPYDSEYNEFSNDESGNNNFVRLDEKILDNLGQNKSLEEFDFFSTEDLNSNSRPSTSCSSSEEELNGVSTESEEQMDTLEEDSTFNNSLSPSTSLINDVIKSNSLKYTNNKRLKRKILYKVKNKGIEAIKSPLPSYNDIVDQSSNDFRISSKKTKHAASPWR